MGTLGDGWSPNTQYETLNDLGLRMWMHKKAPLRIQFIYLGYKEIYCFFKALCIISILF